MLYTALKNAFSLKSRMIMKDDRLEASINRDAFRYDVEPDIPDVPADKTVNNSETDKQLPKGRGGCLTCWRKNQVRPGMKTRVCLNSS